MKPIACAAVRRRLSAFHDGELSVKDRLAVASHLRTCASCALDVRGLQAIGDTLRAEAQVRAAETPDFEALGSAVLGRIQAERETSIPAQVIRMFEDMHLVWAGLSATAATVTCAALLFAIWFLSPPERADSISGLLSAMAAPGSDRNPVSLDQRVMRLPRVTDDALVPAMLANTTTEEDLVFALAAVVTQEGRVAKSEVLLSNPRDRVVVLRLMNAVSEARFQPASLRGNPVAVNLVWLLTHTTVRGKIHS
jgi:hypothetical protein